MQKQEDNFIQSNYTGHYIQSEMKSGENCKLNC